MDCPSFRFYRGTKDECINANNYILNTHACSDIKDTAPDYKEFNHNNDLPS